METNLHNYLQGIADAIKEKTGDTTINAQDFASKIESIEVGGSAPRWTGHADVEGLKAIGWDDDDIAYYQEHGVNWNEEEDEYHKVSDDNKALYGVLTANNISTYKARIVYLPKIDISTKTSLYNMFNGCITMVAIPKLNTSNVTNMNTMFFYCYALVTIPPLDTRNVTDMGSMFNGCTALSYVPELDTLKVTNMGSMFASCSALASIPPLNTQKVTNMNYMFSGCRALTSIPLLDTTSVTTMQNLFNECYSLASIPPLDTQKVTNMSSMFQSARSLTAVPPLDMSANTNTASMLPQTVSLVHAYLKNLKQSISLNNSALLSKDSLLYIINNEAATEPITITLQSYAYKRLAEDADVVAALANHPNISLAK